jgi:hypothetical protein
MASSHRQQLQLEMFHEVLKDKEFTLCTMMIISQNVGPNENYIGL